MFRLYKRVLLRRPYLVQAVQTAALMGAGDLICQTVIEKKSLNQTDFVRTMKFSSIGLFVGGPALRFWYGKLNQYFGSTGKTTALKKVCLDQFVFAPAFLLLLLGTVDALNNKNLDEIEKSLRANYLDVLKTNYYLWPWVQLVNFYFVPLQYQVLIVQTVALFWNTYISWKANRGHNSTNNIKLTG